MYQERWKEIDFNEPFFGVEDYQVSAAYEVSNWGRIRKDGKLVSSSNFNGYKFLRVYLGYDRQKKRGLEKRLPVHRIVAWYFVDNEDPKENTYVSFNDGDPQNCQSRNLVWIHHSDASRKGYQSAVAKGTWKGNSPTRRHVKLDKQKVNIIRKRHAEGVAPKRLARQFGVSTMQISRVVNRVDWKGV